MCTSSPALDTAYLISATSPRQEFVREALDLLCVQLAASKVRVRDLLEDFLDPLDSSLASVLVNQDPCSWWRSFASVVPSSWLPRTLLDMLIRDFATA